MDSMVSAHCITLLEHIIKVRSSSFNIYFVSEMKLTTVPLVHCLGNTFQRERDTWREEIEVSDTLPQVKMIRVVSPWFRCPICCLFIPRVQ